jgi:GxxExxY protein
LGRKEGGEKRENIQMEVSDLTKEIIGAAIEVHRALGPGLLESVHETCLCHEPELLGIQFERQKPLSVVFKKVDLDYGYHADLLVSGAVVVEIKAVDELQPIHDA